jgi:twitching motility protein PilJ
VVADEVQRLAENAREATAEIASMVNNIRVETSDTVNIMNKLIAEVAEGTRLGEQAEKRMEVTEDATRQLVETVQVISHSSVQQAQISNKLRDRANIIRHFTEKTGGELVQQKHHTDSLKHFAEVLLERVNVFVLPENLIAPASKDGLDAEVSPREARAS